MIKFLEPIKKILPNNFILTIKAFHKKNIQDNSKI